LILIYYGPWGPLHAFFIQLRERHLRKMGLTVKYKLKKTWPFKITPYLCTRKEDRETQHRLTEMDSPCFFRPAPLTLAGDIHFIHFIPGALGQDAPMRRIEQEDLGPFVGLWPRI
jgi:hypothetical protein